MSKMLQYQLHRFKILLDKIFYILELRLVLSVMIPWKNHQYYADYYLTMQNAYVRKNRKESLRIRRYLWLVPILFLIVAARLILFFYIRNRPMLSIVCCDFIWILGLEPPVNLIFLSLVGLVPAVQYVFFAHWEPAIQPALVRILVNFDNRFFIRGFLINGHEEPADYLRWFTVRVLNILQMFTVTADLAMLYIQIAQLIYVFQYGTNFIPNLPPMISTLLALAVAEVFYLATFLFFMQMVHICILCGAITIASIKAYMIKMHQLELYIKELSHTDQFTIKSARRLTRWLKTYRRFVVILLRANQHYSPLLPIFFMLNLPANCYFTLCALYFDMSFQLKVFVFFIWLYQCDGLFGLHYLIAMLNSQLRRPNRTLTAVAARFQDNLKYRDHLRLILHLETFHARRKIGLSYGPFGLISMMSFSKNVLAYTQLLMYAYQLLRPSIKKFNH